LGKRHNQIKGFNQKGENGVKLISINIFTYSMSKNTKKVRTKKQMSESARKAVEAGRLNHPEWGQKKREKAAAKDAKKEPDESEE